MAEQIITKKCCTCKQVKPVSEFYKKPDRKDGFRTSCKNCEKAYRQTPQRKVAVKRYWKSKKGKITIRHNQLKHIAKFPERRKAKDAVHHAVEAGKLPYPKTLQCSYCPKQAEEYHHPNYKPEHWLDVIPVCRKCHIKIHNSKRLASNLSLDSGSGC